MTVVRPKISKKKNNVQMRITVAERLVKRVTPMTDDDNENVRSALAMIATELAPILGKEPTITHLLPPVLLLLRDEKSEVRLNIISSLGALNKVVGVDLLSQSLRHPIQDLAKDGKWRIRLAIIQNIPLLAKQLGKDFFNEELKSLCMNWLGDDISTIRQAGATNLKELTEIFGSEWAIVYLIPSLSDLRKNQSYLRRLTAVQALCLMGEVMQPDFARIEVLPIILEMAYDVVPNIRFNVSKGLQKVAPVCGKVAYSAQIRPILRMLLDDTDRDVRFYTRKCMEVLDEYEGHVAL
mmetsp:Transcript_15409/g.21990  ORF Transcript_15409/g.21990 Transcript_15409/m.21990 type:complete len:295 (-) Transcript_15409:584-1468(-)